MLPRAIFRSFKPSKCHVKLAHSDIQFPNFDENRCERTKNPQLPAQEHAAYRKGFSCLTSFAVGVAGLYSAKSHLLHYVKFMGPSEDVLAVATTEVDIKNVPEGKVSIIKWRGLPVFIYHRSQATIDQERNVNITMLRDPASDESRVQRSDWLVVLGICTHLGCVPIPNAGMIAGGFYCPCHGSHYDAAGRIRKGPAPTNLQVPVYKFIDDGTLLIG